MIQEFVDKFMSKKGQLEQIFKEKHPEDYKALVSAVISIVGGDGEYELPDKNRIHQIDDGDYQGTLIFLIAAGGYKPCDYWYVKVGYGSCSGCDTLQGISGYSDDPPTDEQVNDYMTLALHVVQGLKKMGDEVA